MKILVMKFRNIGDVLLTTPLLENLKHYYPDVQIHFALNRGCEAMIDGNPNINKIHIYDRKNIKKANIFKRLFLEYKFAKSIKDEKFDIVIQTTEGERGLFISIFSGAKIVISYKSKKWFLNKFITYKMPPQNSRHTVEANLDAIKLLGNKIVSTRVKIYFDDFSNKFNNLPKDFIHIHPMSRWLFKCIKDEVIAEIIDYCELSLGKKVVITCDKNEKELKKTEHIVSLCKSYPMLFLGNLNLKEVSFLNSKSSLFIGVDTAIMHIAAANDIPVFAFFGPSGAFHWGPWDNSFMESNYTKRNGIQAMGKHTVFQKEWKCAPCGRAGCNNSGISKCLVDIEIQELYQIKKIIENYLM